MSEALYFKYLRDKSSKLNFTLTISFQINDLQLLRSLSFHFEFYHARWALLSAEEDEIVGIDSGLRGRELRAP